MVNTSSSATFMLLTLSSKFDGHLMRNATFAEPTICKNATTTLLAQCVEERCRWIAKWHVLASCVSDALRAGATQ